MKKLYLFLFLLAGLSAFAQGENDNWFFNYNAGLNFSNGTTTPVYGSQMTTLEAVGAISRPNGDLLFYTDGTTIWNRQHEVMLNGTGLSGNYHSEQLIILPHPANNNLYYVFTMAYVMSGTWSPEPPGGVSAYSVVDMSLGGIGTDGLPLGGVDPAIKNIHLLNDTGQEFATLSENIAATPHADEQSYWVLFPNGGKLYSYRLDNEGFHNTPVASNLPNPVDPVQTQMHIRISPKLSDNLNLPYSNLISITRWNGGLSFPQPNYGTRVFSFNDSTGLITNDYLFVNPANASYSSEFSENGEVLYQGVYLSAEIIAFDLFTTDVTNIRRSLLPGASNRYCGAIQRATNGEIYINLQGPFLPAGFLAKINNNNSFVSSTVDFNGVQYTDPLSNTGTRYGLPPLVPILPLNNCRSSLTLGFPEPSNIVHQVSSTITTNNFYKVNSGRNVNLKGGNYVLMLPNTTIESGSVFVAEIDGCTPSLPKPAKLTSDPVKIILNGNAEINKISIYPNPVIDIATISVIDAKIDKLTLYTKEGKIILNEQGDDSIYKLDMSRFEKGIYLLTITTDKGEVITDKLIKN